jgi:hypothetical protein
MRHILGIYTALPSAARTVTQNILGSALLDPAGIGNANDGAGLIAYLNVTAVPTVETLILKVQEQNPISGAWSDVAGLATSAQAASGQIKLKVFPGIVAVAPSVTAVQVSDLLPPLWRLVVVHSASGSFTYSLAVVVYNLGN